jgi:hypothetical protein
MSTALLHTEHGLQVRTGATRAAHADRIHRQPGAIVPAGRNSFELATREGGARWEDTYVTAEQAAAFLGLSRPDQLAPHIVRKELVPYRRKGSERRLFRRADVEALVEPATEKAPARGCAAQD